MNHKIEFAGVSASDKERIFSRLEKISNIGWCVVDLNDKVLRASEHLAKTLCIEDGIISITNLRNSIHPDYLYRSKTGRTEWEHTGVYDQTYPILVGSNYVWIHVKFGHVEKDSRGHNVAIGTIQIIEEKDHEQHTNRTSKVQMTDLLQSQEYISKMLLRLLQSDDIDGIINEILANIINKFNADRSYIFSFNLPKRTHSCEYEVTKLGVTSEMDELQDFPMDGSLWWCNEVLANKTIILADINVLDGEHPDEFEVLSAQSIKSLMVVPLITGQGVWGYIGVDIVDYNREWNDQEIRWFETISNYISVCLELHRAIKSVKRRNTTMRSIYRNLPLGIELYNAKGELEDINDVDLKIFNCNDRSAILGSSIFEHPILSADQINTIKHSKDIAIDVTHTFDDTTRKFYKNTHEGRKDLFVKCNILYDNDDNIEHYLMMFIDNTALMDAFHKMQESEALFNSISEFAEVGYYRIDINKKDFYATPQWYNNMYMEPTDRLFSDFYVDKKHHQVIHPDDRVDFQNHIQQLTSGKTNLFKQTLRVCKDGEWRWLRCINMGSDYDPETGTFTLTGLNDNITETKLAELNLIAAKKKAEESDKLKSAFLANMSHEIRTPLNAIVGFSSILNETDNKEERAQYISIIQQNNDQLLQLIADILDLSKIEAGVLDISLSQLDVNSLCENAVSTIAMRVHQGVSMSFEAGLPQCQIYSDKNRLTQVLSNFLGNAAKFTFKGYIKLSYKIIDGAIEFSVEDTGSGITLEQTKTVFERFVKFNHFIPGTGLGLPICKSIAEKLDGDVGVESEVGVGTRFWIRLPYKSQEEGEQSKIIEVEPIHDADNHYRTSQHGSKKTILVAEDNDSNSLLVSKSLHEQYNIIRANTGTDAVTLHKQYHSDLILMDIKMPDMDGLEATCIIRQTDKNTPIIGISAFAYESDRENALGLGFTEYLAKPILPEALRKVVNQYLQQ